MDHRPTTDETIEEVAAQGRTAVKAFLASEDPEAIEAFRKAMELLDGAEGGADGDRTLALSVQLAIHSEEIASIDKALKYLFRRELSREL